MPNAVPQIRVANLHKTYPQGEGEPLEILKGVDLTVQRGETLSIMGASGAGKSTLMHMLGALDTADEGEIDIDGIALRGMTREQAASFRNEHIGLVFQFHHLLGDFSALENVGMPMRIGGSSPAEADRKAKVLLEQVGLGARMNHRPSQLSGGEQQRVAVARAAINSPKILLADEPTGNLDHETGIQILDLMLKLNKDDDITLIVITHNPELAEAMGRQCRMEDGRLHAA